tara:strand:- start:327 stop:1043 length:717 start_codon:yes stop_codon:yes gene_type:complete
MHEAPTLNAFLIQDEVRQAFEWSEVDDAESALQLQLSLQNHQQWSPLHRENTLRRVKTQLLNAQRIIIIGAGVEENEFAPYNQPGDIFVAADGAVGALQEYSQLACIVSDLDGGEYLDAAAKQGQTIVVHAHGDNMHQWKKTLASWEQYTLSPPLILSHQVNQDISGMHNFGGFTDGDRALCLVLSLGVEPENIELIGFTLNRIGQWSGVTVAETKLKKLEWMERIVSELGFGHFVKK